MTVFTLRSPQTRVRRVPTAHPAPATPTHHRCPLHPQRMLSRKPLQWQRDAREAGCTASCSATAPHKRFPGGEPASVILENASLLNHPPHLQRQPASSTFSPAFIWAGVGQPGGARSAQRCQLSQPAAPPAVPAAGVVGTHQKSLEKHENINHAPHPQLGMGLEAKGSQRLCRFETCWVGAGFIH